jgi:alpha-mannosidase
VAEGYALNLPLRTVAGGTRPAEPPLVTLSGNGVTVEAVKLADDRSGDVVVRLYETLGGRARTVLHTGFPLARAKVVDLLERPLPGDPLPLGTDGGVGLSLRPFQVLTLRLARA